MNANDLRKSKVVLGNVYGAIEDATGVMSKGAGLFQRATISYPIKPVVILDDGSTKGVGTIRRSIIIPDARDPDDVSRLASRQARKVYGRKDPVELDEVRIQEARTPVSDDEPDGVRFSSVSPTRIPGLPEGTSLNVWKEALNWYGERRVLDFGPLSFRSLLAVSDAPSQGSINELRGGKALMDSMALTSPINGKDYVTLHALHPDHRDFKLFQLSGRRFARALPVRRV